MRALFVLLFTLLYGPALADVATPAAPADANVTVNNRIVVTMHATLLGFTPEQRAEAAAKRIRRLLGHGSPTKLAVTADATGAIVQYDGDMLFIVGRDDVDIPAGETLTGKAEAAKQQVAQLLEDSRGFDNASQYVTAIAKAMLATVLLAAAFWALSRLWRLWLRLTRYLLHRLAGPKHWRKVLPLRLIRTVLKVVSHLLLWPTVLAVVYVWLSTVLRLFPYTRVWGEELDAQVIGLLTRFALAIISALPSVTVVLLILLITRWATKGINYLFRQLESGRVQLTFFDRDTAETTRKLLTVAAWLFSIAMIYPYLPGANTEAFKGLSVMVGLMVSLGASSVVGQLASGLILIYSRAIKVGEYVAVGAEEGTVAEIGLFATKIHTNLREELSIPNSVLVSQSVKNFSRLARGGGVICKISVTIGYDTPWRQVEAMLLEGATRTDGIRNVPAPRVFQTALSDFYVEYHLRFAIDDPAQRIFVLSVLNGNVQDVFNENRVQIMSPHYVEDPQAAKMVKPEDFYLAPAKKPEG
ncbi:mechanosensitive ion channel family protein [Andreprevotia chitinilytica]|uniref:mechanosensitive ion channel family protein n=1 Tax=Andreprevotia chitinilytica TaxID=396808 RepID=UPI0005574094|nr:mechanosensitive ion channel domain-containing protein [Andreprevotia chitinilytica]